MTALRELAYPPKPAREDMIAVVSPSGRAAAYFPAPFELGLRRLADEFDLRPVEYPTTRATETTPAARADDLHAAFADPATKAVMSSIGGDDELKCSPISTPISWLAIRSRSSATATTRTSTCTCGSWLVSYHGGAVMVQLARAGSMHPLTTQSLEQALFARGTSEFTPADEYSHEEVDWGNAAALETEPPMDAADDWSSHGPATRVSGPTWQPGGR